MDSLDKLIPNSWAFCCPVPLQFVTTNPRIFKPRVTGSNPVGRANNLAIFKISLNLSLYVQVLFKFDPLKSYNSTRLTHKEIGCNINL